MSTLLRWVAYYTDDRVFHSEDTTWQALPSSGLLVVVMIYDTGRTFYNGGDWYIWENGGLRYIPSGEWGTNQPFPDVSCLSCVKEGVGVSDIEFAMVTAKAWKETE